MLSKSAIPGDTSARSIKNSAPDVCYAATLSEMLMGLAGVPPRCIVHAMSAEFSKSDAMAAKRNFVDALYRTYSEALSRFLARQRVRPDEVADIVQETYCRIQQVNDVDAIRNPKAFLFRVASNIRFNARKRHRNAVEEDLLDIEGIDIPSDEPSAYRSFMGEQDLKRVRAAFDELGDSCREAFVMNRFEGLTFAQIATRLGVSVSMVEKHVAHAVSHMKKSLEESQSSTQRKSLRAVK